MRGGSPDSGSKFLAVSIYNLSLKLFFLSLIFLHPKIYNFRYQRKRHWFIERKLDRSFCKYIFCYFFLKFFGSRRRGIKADMILPCGKVYQVSIKLKCGHLVTNGFFGLWRGFLNGDPDLF